MTGDISAHRECLFQWVGSFKEGTKSTGMVCQAYLCWCRTSSSRLLPSRLLVVQPCRPELGVGVWKVLMPPRGVRMEDWHTWRANPLILFSPRNPLVLAFFLNCCRKAFSPVGDKSRGISRPGSRLCRWLSACWSLYALRRRRKGRIAGRPMAKVPYSLAAASS